jgi:hypothetical protein
MVTTYEGKDVFVCRMDGHYFRDLESGFVPRFCTSLHEIGNVLTASD